MSFIQIFSDGACSGNPGPGGWGAIVRIDGHVEELCGADRRTTNNRMELQGLIESLIYIGKRKGKINVYSDSVYVLRGASQWAKGWKRRGWKTASGTEVLNRDLWEVLHDLVEPRMGDIKWHYVRGHTGVPGNERCDELAVAASLEQPYHLYRGALNNYPVDLTVPDNTDLPPLKSHTGEKSKPYAYLSLIGGEAIRHDSWSKCEARVKGRSGAKFKKVMSPDEELVVLDSWGVPLEKVKDEN